jgi:hypothetical protein
LSYGLAENLFCANVQQKEGREMLRIFFEKLGFVSSRSVETTTAKHSPVPSRF